MMRSTAVAVVTLGTLLGLARHVSAQANPRPDVQANTRASVSLGFAFQSGRKLVRGVQHFPLGPRIGLDLQGPMPSGFEWAVAADVAYYVQDATNRNGFVPQGPDGIDPDRSLMLGTTSVRLESPPMMYTSLFVAGGEAFAVTTPRPGDRASPLVEIGLHTKFDTRASARIGYQYFINRIGETRFQIPISFDIVL